MIVGDGEKASRSYEYDACCYLLLSVALRAAQGRLKV